MWRIAWKNDTIPKIYNWRIREYNLFMGIQYIHSPRQTQINSTDEVEWLYLNETVYCSCGKEFYKK